MVKAAPPSSFKVAETHLLLQFLIVALPAPTLFRLLDQRPQGAILRQRAQPVLGWFRLALRPLDQEPFFRTDTPAPVIPMCGPDTYPAKPRTQETGRALAPSDSTPSGVGQAERHLLDRNRLVLLVAAQQFRRGAPPLCSLGCE